MYIGYLKLKNNQNFKVYFEEEDLDYEPNDTFITLHRDNQMDKPITIAINEILYIEWDKKTIQSTVF